MRADNYKDKFFSSTKKIIFAYPIREAAPPCYSFEAIKKYYKL